MAGEQRQQGIAADKAGTKSGGGKGVGDSPGGGKRPDDGVVGKAPRPEDGGPLQGWDPDTTSDGMMGGGGAGGAGGVTGGASGRTNAGG